MKILVVRFKLMGDAILASALCDSLRLSFPGASIDYVTYAPYSELFKFHPAIDNVIGIDRKIRNNPFKYLKFVQKVASKNYDIVIDAQGTAKSNFFSLFSKQAQFRISSARKRFSFGHTHQVARLHAADKIEERLNLLTPLTDVYKIKTKRNFQLRVTDAESSRARQKLLELGVDLQRPLFAFAVSANETFKKWSWLEMRKLLEFCRDEYQAQILLFHGLPDEQQDVEVFASKLASSHDVYHGFNIESIRCLPALFSVCDLFVGNEGGPRHIAQAVGTPSVAIYSPSAYKSEWLPKGDPLHRGFEWRDVKNHHFDENTEFEVGDSEYFRRYNSIKAEMVKPLIVDVLERAVSVRRNNQVVVDVQLADKETRRSPYHTQQCA